MIKFFRKIRQHLLAENKFSKYLLYALGEIILVVIGILIALQINNWNEGRKTLKEEKATIASLKLEFQKNLIDLESNMSNVEAFINAGNVLLDHIGPDYMEGDLGKVDSLIGMTFRMAVWDPSLYTLSNIKNSGKLSKLSNNNLKERLIEWESFYSNLLSWYDFYISGGKKYFEYLEEHAIVKNLTSGDPLGYGISNFEGSNEELLKLKSYENVLVNRVFQNRFILRFYNDAKQLHLEIISECETYED
ncbi:DUF6090 family protein [Hanstruepera ponticola]|uniref:DUF6090 family protein n=1 Tax=Hanstruepera ponticola TaxID=2042995 RepID=UPI00177D32BE|nr:DUF6090 family protein [Hanstruepera ponticola]